MRSYPVAQDETRPVQALFGPLHVAPMATLEL
jgi:hypothetical protein